MKTREVNLPHVSLLWNNYDFDFFKGQLISKATGKPLSITKRQRNHYYTLSWIENSKRNYYATTVGRIVIAWFTGKWPTLEVDHINRDTADNRLINLRAVNARTNSLNRSTFKGGVSKLPSGNWRARIRVNGKQISIGTFALKEDALNAYQEYVKQINAGQLLIT